MAFFRTANARVVKAGIDLPGWDAIRTKSGNQPNFGRRDAAKIVLQEYQPSDYMLTHCTIIASVDTEKSDAPIGKQMVDGFQIDRKYADWLVKPDTTKYINNNQDCWERKLLLASFRTFVGGENYVEHIQIPELSKGKLLDAAARDLGDTVYVDILIATDRKHKPLITAIKNGSLQTLSMGCQVEFTICTKCGNTAYDETQLCPHIRFFKGNKFIDEQGIERKIAELCGHINEEPGSVKFIEASWVANPAFEGAVLRQVISPEEIHGVEKKLNVAFSMPARIADPGTQQKAARTIFTQEEFPGGDDMGGQAPAKEEDPLNKAVESLVDMLKERAIEKVRGQIGKDDASKAIPDENGNGNLVKEAMKHPSWRAMARVVLGTVKDPKIARKLLLGLVLYKHGGWEAVRSSKALTGREILGVARLFDLSSKKASRAGDARIYRAVVAVGGIGRYADEKTYLAACRQVVGRDLTDSERVTLLARGHLFSLGS